MGIISFDLKRSLALSTNNCCCFAVPYFFNNIRKRILAPEKLISKCRNRSRRKRTRSARSGLFLIGLGCRIRGEGARAPALRRPPSLRSCHRRKLRRSGNGGGAAKIPAAPRIFRSAVRLGSFGKGSRTERSKPGKMINSGTPLNLDFSSIFPG